MNAAHIKQIGGSSIRTIGLVIYTYKTEFAVLDRGNVQAFTVFILCMQNR